MQLMRGEPRRVELFIKNLKMKLFLTFSVERAAGGNCPTILKGPFFILYSLMQ